jgi:hypothetical protein
MKLDHWTICNQTTRSSEEPGRNPSEIKYPYPPPYRVPSAIERRAPDSQAPLRRPLKIKVPKSVVSKQGRRSPA